jgi:hypothetical protein
MDSKKDLKTYVMKIKKYFLSLGTPPEKEVLYKEVIKREEPTKSAEAMVFDDFKQKCKTLFQKTKVVTVTFVEKAQTQVQKFQKKDETEQKSVASKKQEETKVNVQAVKTPETSQEKVVEKETKKATSSTKVAPKPEQKTKKVTPTAEKKPAKKSTAKPSKRDEKIKLYAKDIKKHLGEVDMEFLTIVVKNLGPSIYKKDAELVSCSDEKELETVRKNFMMKKLAYTKEDKTFCQDAIQDVCQILKGVRTKYRATFYYMLAKNLKKTSMLSA